MLRNFHGRGLVFFAAVLLCTGCGGNKAGEAIPASPSPQARVESFYRGYLQAEGQPDEKLTGQYLTAALLQRWAQAKQSPDGLRTDYFLGVQDWPDSWATHVSASQIRAEGPTAEVAATLGAEPDPVVRRNLKLVHENDEWKIDSVSPAAP